jgi:hypothetical protein
MALSILVLVKSLYFCMYCIIISLPGLYRQIRCATLFKSTLLSITLFLLLKFTTYSLRQMLLPVLTYLTTLLRYLTSLLLFASFISLLSKFSFLKISFPKFSLSKFPLLSFPSRKTTPPRMSTAEALMSTITSPMATAQTLCTMPAAEAMQTTPETSPPRMPATTVAMRAVAMRQSPRPKLCLLSHH